MVVVCILFECFLVEYIFVVLKTLLSDAARRNCAIGSSCDERRKSLLLAYTTDGAVVTLV